MVEAVLVGVVLVVVVVVVVMVVVVSTAGIGRGWKTVQVSTIRVDVC